MWKLFAAIATVFSVCTMAGCEVAGMSRLEDLSKPYTGVYECKKLRLGERDLTAEYSVLLELDTKGTYTLSYTTPYGAREEWEGTYEVDVTRGEITMSAVKGSRSVSRTYSMRDGSIVIDENFLGKPLRAEFTM